MMRTTLNLPDDVADGIRSVAENKRISLGDATAELVRRALRPTPHFGDDAIFPCFSVAPDAPPITLDRVLAIEDEL
jgi:hypothetical protein